MFRIDRNLVKLADTPLFRPDAGESLSHAAGEEPEDPAATGSIQNPEAIERAEAAAERIVEEAREEAGRILEDAQAGAKELQAQAFESGYADGLAAATAEAEETLRERQERDAQSVRRILSEIEGERARIMDGLEAEIVNLTLSMVKKIINISEETDDKIFESMISKALKQIKPEGRVTVRVSSAEYEKYFSSGGAAFDLGEQAYEATVVPDSALGFFDCVIDTDGGTIDAGLDSQLVQIKQAFDEAAANEDD